MSELNLQEVSLNDLDNMTEQKYLDLANTMKEIVEEKDVERKKEIKKKEYLQKKILRCYGVLHLIYEIISESDLGMYSDTVEHNLEYCLDQIKDALDIDKEDIPIL